MSKYRVKLAFDFFSVGQLIEPTGLWRDSLLSRGFIEPVQERYDDPISPVEETNVTTIKRKPRRHRHGNGDSL